MNEINKISFLCLCLLSSILALEDQFRVGSSREERKLFGGYRITPRFCQPTRQPKDDKGPNICMFNHECAQRDGEVVGACMDGFLFGACCHLPAEAAGELIESDINSVSNVDNSVYYEHPKTSTHRPSYSPYYEIIKTTTYAPSVSTFSIVSSGNPDESASNQEILPTAEDNDVIQISSSSYTHFATTGVTHRPPDTDLLHDENEIHSTDFGKPSTKRPTTLEDRKTTMRSEDTTLPYSPDTPIIHISISNGPSTYSPSDYGTYANRPMFRPKPSTPANSDKYVLVPTISHISNKTHVHAQTSSAVSLLDYYNETSKNPYSQYSSTSNKPPSTSYIYSSTTTKRKTTTKKPPSTSYVYSTTLPPRRSPQTTTPKEVFITTRKPTTNIRRTTTKKPPSTSYVFSTTLPPRRTTTQKNTTKRKQTTTRKPVTKPNKTNNKKTTPPTLRPLAHSTFAATPGAFHTTKQPPSTYVYSSPSTIKPPSIVDTHIAGPGFAVTSSPYPLYPSPAPTLIVLSPLTGEEQTVRPVQRPQRPQPPNTYQSNRPSSGSPPRKPINQVTINNHVTQNIHTLYSTSERPTGTILITPKPPISSTSRPPPDYLYGNQEDIIIQSPDEFNNFPPVRNPNLNMSVPILTEDDITTPGFIEDQALQENVEAFVNKIIQGLQEPFQGLRDVVYNKNNSFSTTTETATKKPVKKQGTSSKPANNRPTSRPTSRPTNRPTSRATSRPTRFTTRRPSRPASSSLRPATTTRTTTRRTTTRRQRPTTTVSTRRPTTTTRRTRTTTRRPTTTIQSYIEQDAEGAPESYRTQCGVRPLLRRGGRIVGGKGAEFGAFPWQVLVRESTWLGLFTKNKCGGVLIGAKYVMTAAHCQPGFLASLVAVFGEFDISGDRESKRSISRNVKRVIVHRQYDAATFENDLALLELESPVQFDEHIVPICLPREGEDFTGRMATVTGWGRLKYGGGVPSVLQEVQVPIMENPVCQEMFRTAGHAKVIHDSFLCAGYANGQKDSCEGDSGGPLVLQRPDGSYQLAGTVSHGIKCAAPYLPGVYMRTTFYKPWITSITGIQ